MAEFQASKQLVLDYWKALDTAAGNDVLSVLEDFVGPDYRWRGMHPFNELDSPETVASEFWQPYKSAFSPIQRRPQIFYAGRNRVDDYQTEWVVSMGHLLGLFNKPWLGIQPTRKMSFLRYAEFNRIDNGKIAETALFIDIMSVMRQAGLPIYPESTGVTVINPGPMTQDGLLLNPQPADEGKATLDLILRMINRLIDTGVRTTKEDLELDWNEDMLWWGPAGIGASYTHEGYIRGHTEPFEDGLEFIRHNGHVLRCAEGNYGGFFGWPSMTMRSTGGYLGLLSSSEAHADMRIVDLYRRDGDKLAENWIFIDHLHFLYQYGVDLLDRQRKLSGVAE